MYICVCKKITEGQLKDSFIKTDCNFNESQKTLGFSSKCGKCKSSVESLVKSIQFKKLLQIRMCIISKMILSLDLYDE